MPKRRRRKAYKKPLINSLRLLLFILALSFGVITILYLKLRQLSQTTNLIPVSSVSPPKSKVTLPIVEEIKITTLPTQRVSPIDVAVKQTGQYTFEGNLPCDTKMGTATDTYIALNNYRHVHGVSTLSWNDNLASIAQMRAAQIMSNGGHSDAHIGLKAYLADEGNFQKAGFQYISENVGGGGCPLLGVHVIEWLFARDVPHNNAQLDPSLTSVGIAVNQSVVDIIFGKDPF